MVEELFEAAWFPSLPTLSMALLLFNYVRLFSYLLTGSFSISILRPKLVQLDQVFG